MCELVFVFVDTELTTNQKGAIAETAITACAIRHGIDVYRPVFEGGRYDLIFGFPDGQLSRVQCKWAPLVEGAVVVRPYSARRAAEGMRIRKYDAEQVDAMAAYCAEVDDASSSRSPSLPVFACSTCAWLPPETTSDCV